MQAAETAQSVDYHFVIPAKAGIQEAERFMQSPQRQFEQRGLGDILNETFVIYGSHFKRFIVLVAVIQLPVALLGAIPVENRIFGLVLNLISFIALTFAYGAAIFAVGQHYVADRVAVAGCYTRVLWRGKSILMLGLAQAALGVAFLGISQVMIETERLVLIAPALVLLALMLMFVIYMTTAAPAVIVEGYRSLYALRRGFALARRSELRILLNLVVYSLLALGLLIVIMLPFLIVASITAAGEEFSFAGQIALTIGATLGSIIVLPVTYIPATLLYYDLRVRKEGYNVSRLSEEMGFATT